MEPQPASHSRRLVQAATLVMTFFVISKVLGLVRDIIITQHFGTSREYDAYLAAFRIPDLIFNLIAGGALGSAFIPPFAALLARSDEEEAWRLASRVMTLVALSVAVVIIGAEVFAEPLVAHTVAIGFSPEDQQLTAHLMRIMLVTPFLFAISGIVTGILNSYHHFLLPSVAPVLYNLGIIGGAVLLAPAYGAYGLAVGVAAGAGMHFLVQLPFLARRRFRFTPGLGLADAGVRSVLRLMAPRTLGIAAVQVNFLINTILASTLPEGRLAAFNIAFMLILLPEGVIAQSIATVLFPTLSQLAARGELDGLKHAFSAAFRIVLFLTIPSSVGLILLRTQIVQVLYQRGAFTADSTFQTAFALQFFAIGLFAHSGLEIITRTFYALHDTATPVKIGLASFALNIALSLLLIGPLAQGGLALANSIATILEMLTTLYLLRRKTGGLDGRQILSSLVKIGLGSAAMAAALLYFVCAAGRLNILFLAATGIALGGMVFLVVTLLLRSDELALAWRMARPRS
ncbi:MAG: murein biosynthesis integral membrane protein MurJ [Rudaea sp.]